MSNACEFSCIIELIALRSPAKLVERRRGLPLPCSASDKLKGELLLLSAYHLMSDIGKVTKTILEDLSFSYNRPAVSSDSLTRFE